MHSFLITILYFYGFVGVLLFVHGITRKLNPISVAFLALVWPVPFYIFLGSMFESMTVRDEAQYKERSKID
jgi:hypothetical protein